MTPDLSCFIPRLPCPTATWLVFTVYQVWLANMAVKENFIMFFKIIFQATKYVVQYWLSTIIRKKCIVHISINICSPCKSVLVAYRRYYITSYNKYSLSEETILMPAGGFGKA